MLLESEPVLDEAGAPEPHSVEPNPQPALVVDTDQEPGRGAEAEYALAAAAQQDLEPVLEPAAELGHEGEPGSESEDGTTGPASPSKTAAPHIAVSWRGADYFEGEPELDESAELIIVEPPSQMYAASGRRRRPEPRVAHDEDPDATPARTDATSSPRLDGSADADQAPAKPTGKSRRALVLAVLLVVVLAAVWYFLLRDPGAGSAAPATGTGSAVVALAPEKSTDRLIPAD